MATRSWQCPFCRQHATIGKGDASQAEAGLRNDGPEGHKVLSVQLTTCPNESCRKYELQAWLYHGKPSPKLGVAFERSAGGTPLRYWQLIPDSTAQQFPDFVPQAIREDYEEACRIAALSPKAAATLARRCLQGMIRDVWKIKKSNLARAIEALKKKVEPAAWKAIDGVRTVGNIGAHMEKDVNQIVPVDPKEAEILLRLIEALVNDWYIKPRERDELYAKVTNVAQQKLLARKPQAVLVPPPPPPDPAPVAIPPSADPSKPSQ